MVYNNIDAIIAVMGGTGTGKSSFIYSLTDDPNIRIGHGQESLTDEIFTSIYKDCINNYSVMLVDTPGFNDSREGARDTDILQRIVDFLQSDVGQKLNGIIYLHRISDPKMGGNAKRNLRMFRELCGESALKNVCIATTNWSRVTQEEGDRRERELRESPNLFKPLIDAGAQLSRWDITEDASAQSIVDSLIRKEQIKLKIQVELEEGKTLEETGAGSVLKEDMIALAKKHKVDMQALQEEIEEATKTKQAELLSELEEERQKTRQQILNIQEGLDKLTHQQTAGDKKKSLCSVCRKWLQILKIQEGLDKLTHHWQRTGVKTGVEKKSICSVCRKRLRKIMNFLKNHRYSPLA